MRVSKKEGYQSCIKIVSENLMTAKQMLKNRPIKADDFELYLDLHNSSLARNTTSLSLLPVVLAMTQECVREKDIIRLWQ